MFIVIQSLLVSLKQLCLGCVTSPGHRLVTLSAFECYPYKVLPPHGAWVIEVNPAIIPAPATTANLYFCFFFSVNISVILDSFYNII